jgi:hypothetical protein
MQGNNNGIQSARAVAKRSESIDDRTITRAIGLSLTGFLTLILALNAIAFG